MIASFWVQHFVSQCCATFYYPLFPIGSYLWDQIPLTSQRFATPKIIIIKTKCSLSWILALLILCSDSFFRQFYSIRFSFFIWNIQFWVSLVVLNLKNTWSVSGRCDSPCTEEMMDGQWLVDAALCRVPLGFLLHWLLTPWWANSRASFNQARECWTLEEILGPGSQLPALCVLRLASVC